MVTRGDLIVMPVSGRRNLPALAMQRTATPKGSDVWVLRREPRYESSDAVRGRLVDILV